MSAKELTSTVYLVLEPTYTRYSPKKLEGFKVTKALTKPPKTAAPVVALEVTLPASVFQPTTRIAAKVEAKREDVSVDVSIKKPSRKGTTWGT